MLERNYKQWDSNNRVDKKVKTRALSSFRNNNRPFHKKQKEIGKRLSISFNELKFLKDYPPESESLFNPETD